MEYISELIRQLENDIKRQEVTIFHLKNDLKKEENKLEQVNLKLKELKNILILYQSHKEKIKE